MVTVLLGSCKKDYDTETGETAFEKQDSINQEIGNDSIAKIDFEDWEDYKEETNKTISENENRIIVLKLSLKKAGKDLDKTYQKKVKELEDKNTALKIKIKDYKINETNWEFFKTEFESDMKGIGEAFKDLTLDNQK